MAVFDEVVHNCRVGQRGRVAELVGGVLRDLAQDAAHDLARPGLGEFADDVDVSRAGDRADLFGDPAPQLRSEALGGVRLEEALFEDDERNDRLTGGLIGCPDNCRLGGGFGAAEWSILASYNHVFTSTFSASLAFQYNNDHYFAATNINTGVDTWATELSMVWTPVQNFEVRSELAYQDVDVAGVSGTFSGFIRFTRYF